MLFSEVYGSYYNVLAEILKQAREGKLTRQSMLSAIREKGFEESSLTILQNLEDSTWPLLRPDLGTPLRHTPTQPLTQLQRQWMKTLLTDPRIRLFDPPAEGLEDVEPLYPENALVYFDRYDDGDPFEDPSYIAHFHIILAAFREKRWLRIAFLGRNGIPHIWDCIPYRLEYSPKDDKFRLITGNSSRPQTINLARISECTLLHHWSAAEYDPKPMQKRVLVLELTDRRNALERCMLHFSHLEKETERLEENRYRLTLRYEQEDETELLIRVLSFGPMVQVVSPDSFRDQLRSRIKKQQNLRTQA